MHLDISNRIGGSNIQFQGTPPPAGNAGRPERGGASLTVKNVAASPEEIEAAGITEAMISRDDALGRAVSFAFNLPPPPMPALV